MNWKNSNFQILYHIIGNCHTAPEAMRVLYELRQDRSFAIKSSLAEAKRSEAKVLAARRILDDKKETTSQKLRSLCDIEEQDARMEIAQPCYDAALQEMAFIEYLIEQVQSLSDRPITPLDFQRIQPIENAYDIVLRSHTSVALTGSPSFELVNESRNSPYREKILAAVGELVVMCSEQQNTDARMKFLAMSKVEVLDVSGIASNLRYPVLNIEAIKLPELESLQCQSFKPKALVSNPIEQTTSN